MKEDKENCPRGTTAKILWTQLFGIWLLDHYLKKMAKEINNVIHKSNFKKFLYFTKNVTSDSCCNFINFLLQQ